MARLSRIEFCGGNAVVAQVKAGRVAYIPKLAPVCERLQH